VLSETAYILERERKREGPTNKIMPKSISFVGEDETKTNTSAKTILLQARIQEFAKEDRPRKAHELSLRK